MLDRVAVGIEDRGPPVSEDLVTFLAVIGKPDVASRQGETAKRLLVEDDEPVKSISDAAGFGTTVSFQTMFKRHTGK